MINQLRLILIVALNIFWIQSTTAQNFRGTWNYKNRTFLYELKPAQKGQRLVIRTTQVSPNRTPTSHTVYNTSVLTKREKGKLKSVKILGSVRDGYIWSAMLDEYLRADFLLGEIQYTTKGEMMTDVIRQVKVPTNALYTKYSTSQDQNHLIELVIRRFIAQYHPSFAVIGNPVKPKKAQSGEIIVAHQNYTYQIKPDIYGKNKSALKLRRKGKGLVFESMIETTDKDLIKIHLAKPHGWSWAMYESDYEQIDFSASEATFKRVGRAITWGTPKQSTLRISEGSDTHRAIQHFIERYHKIFRQ